MANTLRFKRGLVAGIPTGVAGEPLFTTDTFDLYIGNGTTNTRFQKYIASGTTLQYLRGDGSLATFPTNIVTGTGVSGQVAYWSGTNSQVGSNNLFWDATNSRLGIGLNNPSTDLHISKAGSRTLRITNSTNSTDVELGIATALGYVGTSTANAFTILTSNTERARIDTSGNLLVGGTSVYAATITSYGTSTRSGGLGIRNSAGTVAGFFGTYAAGSGSGSTDIFVESAGFILFNAGGSERMKLYSATGNFAIGSTASDTGEKLQVNGTMKVTGASTFGGDNNQIAVNTTGLYSSIYLNVNGNSRGALYSTDTITRLEGRGTGGLILAAATSQTHLTIASTGAATFSSSGKFGGQITGASGAIEGKFNFLGYNGAYGGIFSNTGLSSSYNAVYLYSNYNAASNGQGNSALPTYILELGGATPNNDSFTIQRSPAGSFTFSNLFKVDGTGAATFSSTLTTGGNILIGATAGSIGSINFIKTGTSPVASRLTFGTDGTGYSFAIGKNQAGTVTDLFSILDSGAANFTTSIQAGTAIAIGTTPDTNKPFKILKNINATVGINFENTSTSSLAFSAIQMGTDVTGGTKFTNLVYGSSGISQNGVYHPDGTSLINNGGGGLNFLGTPTRFYTGGSNGVVRLYLYNNGLTQLTATTPTTNETDGYRQYSADVVAGNAAPHFRTENGAVIKLYQETTAVGNSTISVGGGSAVLDDTQFGGYTLRQVVQALRNQGILA
jgi:hypothetical protein